MQKICQEKPQFCDRLTMAVFFGLDKFLQFKFYICISSFGTKLVGLCASVGIKFYFDLLIFEDLMNLILSTVLVLVKTIVNSCRLIFK